MIISAQPDIIDFEMDCAGVTAFDKDVKSFTMERVVKQLQSFQLPDIYKKKIKRIPNLAEVDNNENKE